MIITQFNHNTNILIVNFEGDVALIDIIKYIKANAENNSYPRKLKILSDATKSNTNLKYEDLSIIAEENSEAFKKFDYVIDAIVLNDPIETALAMLYKETSKNNKYKFKIFSTREAAMRWLENH